MISRGSTSRYRKPDLPIDRHKRAILYSLEQCQVLILVGDTGSGKSTRIPQFLFSAGRYNKKLEQSQERLPAKHQSICITQPRRVAAIQLAQRVSQDLGCELGVTVGYAIRFKDASDPEHTMIKYVTEGLLIREMMIDPFLQQYSVIIVDEVHERNSNTDLLLGLLKCITVKRQDLKIIICSATLNVEEFTRFFTYDLHGVESKPAVLRVEGKSYSTQVFYKREPVANYMDAAVDTVVSIHESVRLASGKILIFLTGVDEVDYVCDRLIDYAQTVSSRLELRKLIVLPLHASLKQEEISQVFEESPRNSRVCIVSTNVAETSLTIDDVAYVIDCGFVKMKIYNPRCGMDSLMRIPISKNSAKQRAGRAGRTREGQVYRLYPEKEYLKLQDNALPELQRSSLTEQIMLLKSLGVDDIRSFPLVSQMPRRNLIASLETLHALGAIDDGGQLTSTGRLMAQLNLDPKLSKILVSPENSSCTMEACRIAALLQVKDIYAKPGRNPHYIWSNASLTNICVTEGDLPSYLNIMNAFLANHKSQKWAEKRNLNHQALLNALEIASKLESQLKKLGIPIVTAKDRLILIQKSIVSGLFINAAYLHPSGEYKTIRGDQTVYVHPTSIFCNVIDKPKYVIFGEILNTTKPFMRHIMAVERDWLLESAPNFFTFQAQLGR